MSYSPGSDKESDVTEHTHTYTMHALVKSVVRNSISYIKTKLEGSCFLSYFLFFFFFSLNFLPLSMFSQVPSPRRPPILPFLQYHSLLDFISLKKHLFICLNVYKTDLDQ